jgi:hypothetical protein
LGAGGSWCSLLYVNGAAAKYGPGYINTSFSALTSTDQHISFSGMVYLNVNDTVRPGAWASTSSHSFYGDSAGKKSWFNMARVSP